MRPACGAEHGTACDLAFLVDGSRPLERGCARARPAQVAGLLLWAAAAPELCIGAMLSEKVLSAGAWIEQVRQYQERKCHEPSETG
jgi:hypothetical protein